MNDESKTKLKEKFINFVKNLSVEELNEMCEARENMYLEAGEFYSFPRNFRDDREGACVYDSEGQSDAPISPNELRKQLIDDTDYLLQTVFFDEDVCNVN